MKSILTVVGCVFVMACGTSQPESIDPVHVEIVACEPTLGTAGQYYKLSFWCREVAFCAIMMPEVQGDREMIRVEAERYARELDREFDEYHRADRTDCYCGPICREATRFIEEARMNGLLCRS